MYHDDAWMTKDRAKNILNRLMDRIEVELHISISVVCGNWVKTWHSLLCLIRKQRNCPKRMKRRVRPPEAVRQSPHNTASWL